MTTIFKSALAIAATATLAATTLLATSAAQARDSEIYQQTYQFNQPMHGYEGHSPMSRKYCSYKRFPIRECRTLRSGKEKCKIVKWELEQTCY